MGGNFVVMVIIDCKTKDVVFCGRRLVSNVNLDCEISTKIMWLDVTTISTHSRFC